MLGMLLGCLGIAGITFVALRPFIQQLSNFIVLSVLIYCALAVLSCFRLVFSGHWIWSLVVGLGIVVSGFTGYFFISAVIIILEIGSYPAFCMVLGVVLEVISFYYSIKYSIVEAVQPIARLAILIILDVLMGGLVIVPAIGLLYMAERTNSTIIEAFTVFIGSMGFTGGILLWRYCLIEVGESSSLDDVKHLHKGVISTVGGFYLGCLMISILKIISWIS